jgi:hypothetical protein
LDLLGDYQTVHLRHVITKDRPLGYPRYWRHRRHLVTTPRHTPTEAVY